MELVILVVAVLVVVTLAVVVVGRRASSGSRGGAVDLEPPPVEAPGGGVSVVEAVPVVDDVPVVEVPVVEAPPPVEATTGVEATPVVEEAAALEEVVERPRFRDRLTRARDRFTGAIGSLRGSRVSASTWDDLEDALISADVGVGLSGELLDAVRTEVSERGITEGDDVLEVLKEQMRARLGAHDTTLAMAPRAPTVWLLVGVNGVGKTTTAGKLARREVANGHRVMLAAGDTFRAAAAEQLGMWAERSGADIVRGADGGDPSAVVFDAVEAAAARGCDLVVADTAGRLHTKSNLMEELGKVRRVADKGAGTVTESLLVLDATTGQNGLVQARQFAEAVELTGVVLTKLDGSAKGGIVLAIESELGVPVKLVGLGEGPDDLVTFDADEFVEALFA